MKIRVMNYDLGTKVLFGARIGVRRYVALIRWPFLVAGVIVGGAIAGAAYTLLVM